MGLLRGSWSEVFTLSIIFRSLPTTVAAASLAAREVSSGNKRKLKFAPDYAMTQNIANKCGLQAFYEQVTPKNIFYNTRSPALSQSNRSFIINHLFEK